MIRRIVKKLGVVKSTIIFMTLSCLSSVALYLVLSEILGQISVVGICMSIAIPAMLVPLLSFSLFRVLTELAMATEGLKQNQEQYHDIFENVSDLLYFHDLDGYFTKTNLPFKIEYGYDEDDLRHLHVGDLIPEGYRHQFDDYLRTIVEKGKAEGLMRVKTKDGRERILEYKNSLICDSTGPIGVRGSARDITEHVRADKALRESEEKYRDLVENIREAIYTIDDKGVMTYISPAIERIAQYSPSEVVGRVFTEFVHQEDLHQMRSLFQAALASKVESAEYRIRKKSGDVCWILTSSQPIVNGGRVLGLRGTITDITEGKLAEEERQRLEKRLQEAQKMEAIGTLAAGVAHDLNNMLVGLVSYPELLLMQIPEDSPLRDPLSTIQSSGEKAATIVQDLLTLAKRGVVAPEAMSLNQLVSDYLTSPHYEKLRFFHPKSGGGDKTRREAVKCHGFTRTSIQSLDEFSFQRSGGHAQWGKDDYLDTVSMC